MNAPAPTLPAGGATLPTFPCPRCRRVHPWSAEHVGKAARCACGQVLKVPDAPQEPAAHPAAAHWRPPQAAGTPAPSMPPAPPAVSALPGMPVAGDTEAQVPAFLRTPAAAPPAPEGLSPEVEAEMTALGAYGEQDTFEPDPRRDTHVPVALLGLGFVLSVVNFAWTMDALHAAGIAGGVIDAVVTLVVGMVLMLVGALLAAKFAGINFGPIGPAILKLAGLCLAPSAMRDLVTTLLGGDAAVAVIGWVVMAVLYYLLISYLFRLDGAQTVVVVMAITIAKVVMFAVLGAALLVGMGSMIEDAGERVRDGGSDSSITSQEADEGSQD